MSNELEKALPEPKYVSKWSKGKNDLELKVELPKLSGKHFQMQACLNNQDVPIDQTEKGFFNEKKITYSARTTETGSYTLKVTPSEFMGCEYVNLKVYKNNVDKHPQKAVDLIKAVCNYIEIHEAAIEERTVTIKPTVQIQKKD